MKSKYKRKAEEKVAADPRTRGMAAAQVEAAKRKLAKKLRAQDGG